MSQVSAEIYNEPGSVRRHVYKELQKERTVHEVRQRVIALLRAEAWEGRSLVDPPPRDDPRLRVAREVEANDYPSRALLAHDKQTGGCGRLLKNCCCVGNNGKPLDWDLPEAMA